VNKVTVQKWLAVFTIVFAIILFLINKKCHYFVWKKLLIVFYWENIWICLVYFF